MQSPGGLERHVAVKLLHRDLNPRGQAIERLRDEARLLASLRHPVVLSAHDLVELEGRIALVTEFVEGEDLSACIDPADPRGRLPASTLLEVIEQVASALDTAYRQLHVVHRDVKPANIRIGSHGNVKLLDFGVARSSLEDRAAQTGSQMLVGTLRYLAPERFDTKQALEPASDVFSLGAVLYEGVTGRPFFGDLRMPELVRLSIQPEKWADFLAERLAEVPEPPDGLRALLADMLAYRVEVRPTAGEVARRCEALTSRTPDHVRLTRWCRDRSWPESPIEAPGTPPRAAAVLQRRAMPTTDPSVASVPSVEPSPVTGPVGSPPVPSMAPPPGVRWARWAAAGTAVGGVSLAVGSVVLGAGLLLALQWSALVGPEPTEPISAPAPVPEREVPNPAPAPAPVHTPEAPAPAPPIVEREPQSPAPRPFRPALPPPAPEPALPEPPVPEPAAPTLPAPPPPEPTPEPAPIAQPRPTRAITLASIPGGAEVRLAATGELLGTTPLVRPLPLGNVVVRWRAPDGTTTERPLPVNPEGPGRYVWHIAENRIEAGN